MTNRAVIASPRVGAPRRPRTGSAKQSRATGAPVIIVHSLAHAVAALSAAAQAGRHITLASAPDAGISAGPGWFGTLVAAAREAVPAAQSTALIDCGDDAGAAMAAIRAGIEAIVFTGRADVAERLADIASQTGSRLVTARPAPALDLEAEFFAAPEALRRSCVTALGRGVP
jgi:hypothetical protein